MDGERREDAAGRATCRAPGRSRSIAASDLASGRSVGTWIEKPLSLNATTPIRTDGGWPATKSRAAALAASIRVGVRSSAAMLPETSKARMTVPFDAGHADDALRPCERRGRGSSARRPMQAAGCAGDGRARARRAARRCPQPRPRPRRTPYAPPRGAAARSRSEVERDADRDGQQRASSIGGQRNDIGHCRRRRRRAWPSGRWPRRGPRRSRARPRRPRPA